MPGFVPIAFVTLLALDKAGILPLPSNPPHTILWAAFGLTWFCIAGSSHSRFNRPFSLDRSAQNFFLLLVWPLLPLFLLVAPRWANGQLDKFKATFGALTGVTAMVGYLTWLVGGWCYLFRSDPAAPWYAGEHRYGVLFLIVVNLCALATGIVWAANPIRPLDQVVDVLALKRVTLVEYLRSIDRVAGSVRTHLVATGLIVQVALFGLTAVNFGVMYQAVQSRKAKAEKGKEYVPDRGFDNLGSDYPSCLMYSVTTLATAPVANVAPKTRIGQVVYSSELVCTFLLVSVLAGTLSSALSVQVGAEAERLEARLKSLIEDSAAGR